jgi:RHS repeat-associated protein
VKRAFHFLLFLLVAATASGNIPRANLAWTNRWSTTMELMPGAHQLTVSALHPSGFFTTNATAWFTNNIAQEAAQVYRDGAGNIVQRIWYAPDGSISQNEGLWLDQKERLTLILNEDGNGNGFEWFAYYDGLDRLLFTIWCRITNGISGGWEPLGVSAQTNLFVYDPQAQFLDMGVLVGPSGPDTNPGQMTWKLCGPDLNGRYGGMNGAGGLEATATGPGYFSPTINDARGNVLGVCDPEHGSVTWTAARPTGYGAVPGYRPLPLGHGGTYAQSAAWRGKWVDVTGYIYIGNRFYDPVAGMWLSPDPVWNSQDPSYWSYAGGDPINHFDPDGRCVEGAGTAVGGLLNGTASLVNNTLGATAYALTSPFAPDWAYQNLGGYAQGLANNVTGTAQFGYNVAATATYGLISPVAPDFAYNNYGGSVQQLMGQAPAFYGGNNQSLPYQIGYGAVNVATMFMGGEASEASNLARVGEIADAGAQAARVAEETAFTSTLNKVGTLDFSTPANGAVFYSGPGQGARAAAFAERTGGMTIEMTPGGQQLMADPAFQSLSQAQQDLIWQNASSPFAQGASGEINAFIRGANPSRTFRTIEEPILNQNQNIYRSIYHY